MRPLPDSRSRSRNQLRPRPIALLLAILVPVLAGAICAHRPALPRDAVTASSLVPFAIRIPAFVLRSLAANF